MKKEINIHFFKGDERTKLINNERVFDYFYIVKENFFGNKSDVLVESTEIEENLFEKIYEDLQNGKTNLFLCIKEGLQKHKINFVEILESKNYVFEEANMEKAETFFDAYGHFGVTFFLKN